MTNQIDKLISSMLSDYLNSDDIKKIMPLIKKCLPIITE